MIYKVYTIYDSKVEAYMQPWYARSKGEAVRSVTNELENQNSNLSKHPEDFILFEIGEFDDSNGSIKSHEPKSIGVLIEFKKSV